MARLFCVAGALYHVRARGTYGLVCAVFIALLTGCGGENSSPLDDKLAHQYQRYENAQKLVVERNKETGIPLAQRMISRAEWENILAPPPDEVLSSSDLVELQARHAQRIRQSRELANSLSVIDFDALRSLPAAEGNPRIREFCQAVPKGGMLHIHPWGNLNQATYQALVEQSNPTIPAAQLASDLADVNGPAYLYPDELAWLRSLPAEVPYLSLSPVDRERLVSMSELPAGTHPFERFEAVFNFVGLAVGGNWENLVRSYEDFAQRAVSAGIFYVEFTDSMSPEELPKYLLLAEQLESKYGLTVRFNIAFFRTDTPDNQNATVLQMLQEINSPVVTGIDLLANESNTPALETGQAIYGPVLAAVKLKGANWRRTMHAGELGDIRNVRDALLLGAERLGHGVRLIEDPVTLQYAIEKHIPIEINLSSNLLLQAVKEIGQHPYLTYLRLGLPVSLSTDDEGIFRTDIINECVVAVGQTDVTYYEYKEMAFNSIRTSFVAEDVKQRLLNELQVRFDSFETR